MEELGERIVPPRERKTIQRAKRLKDHALYPGVEANGRYHIKKWEAFINALGSVGHTERKEPEPTGLLAKLKEARIRVEIAQADKLERENQQAAGLLAVKADVVRDVATLFKEVVAALSQVSRKCAPTVITVTTPAEAEKIIADEMHETLMTLVTDNVPSLQ